MTVSIVLRTKNEAKSLPRMLGLIRRQAYKPKPEIIAVDSGSTDETIGILKGQNDIRVLEIPGKEFTFGRSLNLGIDAASGEVVVALSAHAFPRGKSWLERLLMPFQDPTVAGVYGRQLPHDDACPSVKRDYLEFYTDKPRTQANPDDPADHYFSNANGAIRRACWEKRPFDEELPGCEDWDWARAALRLGFKIVYAPDAAVYHSHNERLQDVYRRSYREAAAQGAMYDLRKRPCGWFQTWRQSLFADIRFIFRNREPRKWLFWAVIYRFSWSYGRCRSMKNRFSASCLGRQSVIAR
jgi:rhamnosyltransferase